MKFTLFKYLNDIPSEVLRYRVLDQAMQWIIPFNRQLGFHIEILNTDQAVVSSPPRRRRNNHVGRAHACALALLGEYTAGLLITQKFSPEQYRLIIARLLVEYHKQGEGTLRAKADRPEQWPDLTQAKDGSTWVELMTEIVNTSGEPIASVQTRWQIKNWEYVKTPLNSQQK